MLAGRCTRPGTAGIFALRGGSWQAAGPVLPAGLTGGRKEPAEVLRMLTLGPLTEALLEAGAGPASTVLAAWSSDGGAHWRLSPPLRATTSTRVLAASFGADGATGLVLAGGRGEAIAGPGVPWRTLPPLPRGTAVLAIGPDGRLDALTAHVSAFADWQLEPGLAGAGRWSQQQQLRITIPYGSSG